MLLYLFDFWRAFGYNMIKGGEKLTRVHKIGVLAFVLCLFVFGFVVVFTPFVANSNEKAVADSTIYTITYSEVDDVDIIKQYDGTNEAVVTSIANTQYTQDSGKVYLYNVSKEGYNFESWWYGTLNEITTFDVAPSGTRYYYINSSTLKQSITVYPDYSPIQYSITYHNMEGAQNPNPATYTIETEMDYRNASKNGYNFIGWYLDDGFTNKVTRIELGTKGDLEVYAKFEVKDFVLTYMYGDYEPITLKFGDVVTQEMLPTPEKEGFIFEGWYTTKGYVNQVCVGDTITRDISLYAKWSKIENPLWRWFTFGGMGLVVVLTCGWFILFNKTKTSLD